MRDFGAYEKISHWATTTIHKPHQPCAIAVTTPLPVKAVIPLLSNPNCAISDDVMKIGSRTEPLYVNRGGFIGNTEAWVVHFCQKKMLF